VPPPSSSGSRCPRSVKVVAVHGSAADGVSAGSVTLARMRPAGAFRKVKVSIGAWA
jgi:hypothetical protein